MDETTTIYGYDSLNRLTSVSSGGATIGSYSSNGDGLRVAKTAGGAWDYKNNYRDLCLGFGGQGPIAAPSGFGSPADTTAWENFGNFHFGIVAAAFGFSDLNSLIGAGFAQIVDDARNGKMPNNPFTDWGDNPTDQAWIQEGLDRFKNCR